MTERFKKVVSGTFCGAVSGTGLGIVVAFRSGNFLSVPVSVKVGFFGGAAAGALWGTFSDIDDDGAEVIRAAYASALGQPQHVPVQNPGSADGRGVIFVRHHYDD